MSLAFSLHFKTTWGLQLQHCREQSLRSVDLQYFQVLYYTSLTVNLLWKTLVATNNTWVCQFMFQCPYFVSQSVQSLQRRVLDQDNNVRRSTSLDKETYDHNDLIWIFLAKFWWCKWKSSALHFPDSLSESSHCVKLMWRTVERHNKKQCMLCCSCSCTMKG